MGVVGLADDEIGVDDVGEDGVEGVAADASQVGADLAALAVDGVALAALGVEDFPRLSRSERAVEGAS